MFRSTTKYVCVLAAVTFAVTAGCGTTAGTAKGATPAGNAGVSTAGAQAGLVPVNRPIQQPGPQTSTPHKQDPPMVPRCTTAQLQVDLDQFVWPGQAGSSQAAELGLTNKSSEPCAVSGYPGLRLVGAQDRPMPTDVTRTDGELKEVTLQPGETAWSSLAWRFTPNWDEEASPMCGGRMFGLLVTPPDETTEIREYAMLGHVCDHGSLYVKPLQAQRPSLTPPA